MLRKFDTRGNVELLQKVCDVELVHDAAEPAASLLIDNSPNLQIFDGKARPDRQQQSCGEVDLLGCQLLGQLGNLGTPDLLEDLPRALRPSRLGEIIKMMVFAA